MTERLTTLAAVKQWLNLEESNSSDEFIDKVLIPAASQFVLNYLNRDSLSPRQYTQNFRGNGKCAVLLHNWPVLSIVSVGAGGMVIDAATLGAGGLPGDGYVIGDPRQSNQTVELFGSFFPYLVPCQIIYTAGYRDTANFTPTSGSLTYTPALWLGDISVTIAGVAATKVASNPTSGQYSVSSVGLYTFASADQNKLCVITFGFVPADVQFAVTQMIGESFKRKDRIGVASKSLAGQETVSYSQMDMTANVRGALLQYKNVVPF